MKQSKRQLKKFIFASLMLIFFLAACNLPSAKTEAEIAELVKTDAAQTIEVMASQGVEEVGTITPHAVSPTVPPTDEPPTPEPASTNTPRPTNTPPPIPTSVPCDRASFVADITVPDGTSYGPNHTFTKTWRLVNNGSCTWTTAYRLVFVSGNAMSGPASVALPGSAGPGQTLDISVSLKSPSSAGSYQGNWMLQNAASANFGIDDLGNTPFWVNIVVGVTEVSFAVTKVDMKALPSTLYTGPCPPMIMVFEANIHASKAGTVSYYWQDQNGVKTVKKNLTFSGAGSKTVNHQLPFTGVGAYPGSLKIYIDNPNHQFFPKIDYTVVCTS